MDKTELENFVKIVSTGIKLGISESGFSLTGDIEIEIAVISSHKTGGKLNIIIAEADGKYEKEKLSRIKFKIHKDEEWSESYIVRPSYQHSNQTEY